MLNAKSIPDGLSEFDLRCQNINSHIKLLRQRYSKPERQEAVAALQERLRSLELEEHRQ